MDEKTTKGVNAFKCDKCHRSFRSTRGLGLHQNKDCMDPNYKGCTICKKVFTSIQTATTHKRMFHDSNITNNAKRETCDICGYSCYKKRSIFLHKKIMHTNKPNKRQICVKCGKKFINKKQTDDHRKDCNEYVCVEEGCDFKASNYNMLYKHRDRKGHKSPFHKSLLEYEKEGNIAASREHPSEEDNEKMYKLSAFNCPKCKQIFKRKTALERHQKFDCLDPNYKKCTMCKLAFKTPKTAKQHQMIYHNPNGKKIMCDICSSSFSSIKSMKNHKWHIHVKKPRMYKHYPNGKYTKALLRIRNHNNSFTNSRTTRRLQQPKTLVRYKICNSKTTSETECASYTSYEINSVATNKNVTERNKRNDNNGNNIIYPCHICNFVSTDSTVTHRHVEENHKKVQLSNIGGKLSGMSIGCCVCGIRFLEHESLQSHFAMKH